jgi:hypothetical protein
VKETWVEINSEPRPIEHEKLDLEDAKVAKISTEPADSF